MAFIDLDEYIMPETPYEPIGKVVDSVLSHKPNAVGISPTGAYMAIPDTNFARRV